MNELWSRLDLRKDKLSQNEGSVASGNKENIKNSRNRRFYVAVVALTFVIFTMILMLSVATTYFSNRRAYADTLCTRADYQMAHITSNIRSYGAQAVYLRNNGSVIRVLSHQAPNRWVQEQMEKVVAEDILNSVGSFDFFVGAALCGDQGEFYLKGTKLKDFSEQAASIDVSQMDFSDDNYVVTACSYGNDSLMAITSPVMDQNQRLCGYVHIFLSRLVYGLPNALPGKEDYLFSTDTWEAIGCDGFINGTLCAERVKESHGLVERLRSSAESGKRLVSYVNSRGNKMMGALCRESSYPIVLLTAVEAADMAQSIIPFTAFQVGISLLLLGLLIFLVYLLLNRTTRPVTHMIEQCSRLANGDEVVEIEAGQDRDLGKLAEAFNSYRKKLEHAAYFDPLLNIGTRYKYIRDIDALISAKNVESFSIFVIDIKEFGKYNDVFSIEVGDCLLREIADRLSEIFNKYLYRMNGDVFLGMMPRGSGQMETSTGIHERLKEKIVIGSFEFQLQCRVSICCYPTHGQSAVALLEKAQSALHQTKKEMLSDTVFYNDEMVETLRRENEILTLLLRRIADRTLEVWYQPIYHMETQTYRSAEALLRLKDDNEQYVSPFEAILIAEKNNAVDLVGDYVLESTCHLLKKLEQFSNCLEYVQVNLSVQELARNNYAVKALDLIQRAGVSAARLGMEVTETMVIQSFSGAIDTLNTLRQSGVRIAMDDFGSGYSGINYLSKLPFDILKIDKELVAQVNESAEQLAFVKTVVELAKIKNIITVAEGVETCSTLEKMKSCGVNCIQGYYFSKPLCEEKFLHFIEQASEA